MIYPPDSLPKLRGLRNHIRHALDHPHGSEPLRELLTPGMKLTIAIDDISIPLPPMQSPDIRQLVLEEVIELAARRGVEDVKLYMANSLHRRMTADEIKHAVGERVFRSFYPKDLKNHDAEDPENLAYVGKTDQGEEVEINKRAMESDLLIYVNINLVAMDGGPQVGARRARELPERQAPPQRPHDAAFEVVHGPAAGQERDPRLVQADGRRPEGERPEGLHDRDHDEQQHVPRSVRLHEQAGVGVVAGRAGDLPGGQEGQRHGSVGDEAPDLDAHQVACGVTGIVAGDTDAVHEQTLATLHRQQLVEVDGQSDIMVVGLPYICPYNVNSIMNPILVHCLGLGYLFNLYRNKPVVRPGGAMIMFHPVPNEFHQVHHPSYVDFFEEVLTETTDPSTIESKYEEALRDRPWYIHLYRKSYAYHGVHPFYMWYWERTRSTTWAT